MDDLISRQEALRTDCFGDGHDGLRAFHFYEDYKKMRDYIKALPSVQPQIIQCKDCKHNPKESWFGCPMSHLSEEQRPETAWCWKGERKDEERLDKQTGGD